MAASYSRNDDLLKTDYCDDAWTCPLCLEAKEQPKLLPCSHSFCQPCLEDLAERHTHGSFPCPMCREIIKIPAGGVGAFKVNFYIEKEKGRPFFRCRNNDEHTKPREIELYCHRCDTYICLECKLGGHLEHKTEKIQSLVERHRADLITHKARLDETMSTLETLQQDSPQKLQCFGDKAKASEREIHRSRDRLMVDTADSPRDEALSSLFRFPADCYNQFDEERERDERDLRCLQERGIEKCVESEKGIGLVEKDRDNYTDVDRLEKVVRNAECTDVNSSHPVLSPLTLRESTYWAQREFLAPVTRVDAAPEQLEGFSVEEVLRCGSGDASAEVVSLFPRENDTVGICYAPSVVDDREKDRRPELFDFSGSCVGEGASAAGRANTATDIDTLKWNLQTKGQEPGNSLWLAKSRTLFMLESSFPCLLSLEVANDSPLRFLRHRQFTLRCGPCRGFDVNDDGMEVHVAVVEEKVGWQRTVRLYLRPCPNPIATYEPPSPETFQPSDVCFSTIQGRTALLVADELGDSVHVLHVEGTRLVFKRHLVAGHSLLVQPTALNVDVKGDVWLACRGGAVLRLRSTEKAHQNQTRRRRISKVLKAAKRKTVAGLCRLVYGLLLLIPD